MKQFKIMYLQQHGDDITEGYYMRDVEDESELKRIASKLKKQPDVIKVDWEEVKDGIYEGRSLKQEHLHGKQSKKNNDDALDAIFEDMEQSGLVD